MVEQRISNIIKKQVYNNGEIVKVFKMGVTNCYLLKCQNGYILIDTSFPYYFDKFIKELREIGIDPSEIKYLLLTHHHDDHAGFASKLKSISGCKIIVESKGVDAITRGTMVSNNRTLNRRVKVAMYVFNKVKNRNYKIDPVSIDENDYIINENDSDIFKKIGIDGKIVYTPGHTVDSISVILKNGDAFVGDVSMNFLNFCGIHFRPIYLYDEEKVFNSWRNIINFGAKMIYPAHGKAFTVENLEKSMYRYTKK